MKIKGIKILTTFQSSTWKGSISNNKFQRLKEPL